MKSDASALDTQIAGSHYQMPIQPVEFIHKNGLGFIVGNVVKYVVRYKQKNGIEDLKKARHYLDMLIEMESRPAGADFLGDRMMSEDFRKVPVATLDKVHEFVLRVWRDVHLTEYEEGLRQEVEDLMWEYLDPHDDHNDQTWSKPNDSQET